MIKKIIIPLIIAYSITVSSAQNEIEISRCTVSEISKTEFLLSYSIKNTFDPESYSQLQVTLPFEKYILQGSVNDGILHEKDFLFSQVNIDLNGDSDFNDTFKLKFSKTGIIIDNVKVSPLLKTTANYSVISPLDEAGKHKVHRLTDNGIPFALRKYSSVNPEVTLGLNISGDIEFRKFANSLLFIEVINTVKSTAEKIQIDGQTHFTGLTNEMELTGGENGYRNAAAKNIAVISEATRGEIKINGITKPFAVRVTYYFAISENLILLNQKIIRIN